MDAAAIRVRTQFRNSPFVLGRFACIGERVACIGSVAWPFQHSQPFSAARAERWRQPLYVAGLGVAAFGGYFPGEADLGAQVGDSTRLWRSHAQTSSGNVQPRTSSPPHRQRPKRRSTQLSILFRVDRAIPGADSAAPSIACHAALHVLRPCRAVHRRRRLTTEQPKPHVIESKNDRSRCSCRGRSRCGERASPVQMLPAPAPAPPRLTNISSARSTNYR
jgi:hypothetical protein